MTCVRPGHTRGTHVDIELEVVLALVVVLLELVAQQRRRVLHRHLDDHVAVNHLRDQLETVVAEFVVVAEEERPCNPAERRVFVDFCLCTPSHTSHMQRKRNTPCPRGNTRKTIEMEDLAP